MTHQDKRYRRLHNAATAILVELEEWKREDQPQVPAPEETGKKRRVNRYQEQFENVRPGSWKKPAHLKKKK